MRFCGYIGCREAPNGSGACARHGKRKCEVEGCNKPHHAKGLCKAHDQAKRRALNTAVCGVEMCGKPVFARGLCRPHYREERKGALAHHQKPRELNTQGRIKVCELRFLRMVAGADRIEPTQDEVDLVLEASDFV